MNFPSKQELSSGGVILLGPLITAAGLDQVNKGEVVTGFALVGLGVLVVLVREKIKPKV